MDLNKAILVKAASKIIGSKAQIENFIRGSEYFGGQYITVMKKIAAAGDYSINYGAAPELKDIQRARSMGEMAPVSMGPVITNPTRIYEKEPEVTSSTDFGMANKTKFYNRLRQTVQAKKLDKAKRLESITPILNRLQQGNYSPEFVNLKKLLNDAAVAAKTQKMDSFVNQFGAMNRVKRDANLLDPSKIKNEGGPTWRFQLRDALDKLKGNRMAQAGIGAGLGGLGGAGLSALLGGGRGTNMLAGLLGAGALGTAGYMYGDKAQQYLSNLSNKYLGA